MNSKISPDRFAAEVNFNLNFSFRISLWCLKRFRVLKSISLRPIVRKTVPSQPFVRHPPLPLFCFPPPVTVFQTVSSNLPNGTPSCPNPKNQPSLNKNQKGYFISSTVAFYQKSIFNFLNPFTNISVYLNLSDIFRFIFFSSHA